MKKRAMSWLLALALCLTLLPTAALAEETPEPTPEPTGQGETVPTPAAPEDEGEQPPAPEQPEDEDEQPSQPEEPEEETPAEQPEQEAPAEEPAQEEPSAEEPAAQVTTDEITVQTDSTGKPVCGTHGEVDGETALTTDANGALLIGGQKAEYKEETSSYADRYEGYYILPAGTYYLAGTLTPKSGIRIASGEVTLCLNGEDVKLDRNATADKDVNYNVFTVEYGASFTLTDCHDKAGSITQTSTSRGRGVEVNRGGTFTMYAGNITENHLSNQGGVGVRVNWMGTFTMYGGSIANNSTAEAVGAGVYVDSESTVTMYGGSITGNQGTGHYNSTKGAGVYVSRKSTFTVSGDVVIQNNTEKYYNSSETTVTNVYLEELASGKAVLTIGEDGLGDSAYIGLGADGLDTPGAYTVAAENVSKSDFAHIYCDDANHVMQLTGSTVLLSNGNPHFDHPICGDASCTDTDHALLEGESWVGVSSLDDVTGAGCYYLTQDVNIETENAWAPVNGVMLCLNGHSITYTGTGGSLDSTINVKSGVTFTLCDCNSSGADNGKITHGPNSNTSAYNIFGSGVTVSGTFIMYGGAITGNETFRNYDGGGVLVYQNGAFEMHGGAITNNIAQYGDGGGVRLKNGATFTMTGGEITGNTATVGSYAGQGQGYGYGGGVCASDTGTVNVSGSAKICNNEHGEGSVVTGITNRVTNNVYLPSGKTIQIVDSLDKSARIGVTSADEPTNVDPVTVAAIADGAKYNSGNIFSDKGDPYGIKVEGSSVNLYNGLPHEHPVCGDEECTDHGDSVKWTGVSSLDEITGAGSYYLTKDIELTATWNVPESTKVQLCLNGHSITLTQGTTVATVNLLDYSTLTLTDCNGSNKTYRFEENGKGWWVQDASGAHEVVGGIITHAAGATGSGVSLEGGNTDLIMYGGTIVGNFMDNGNGGGVYKAYGTVTLNGGAICGNRASSGGGVYAPRGRFHMNGGVISDNTANYGGGVYIRAQSDMTGGTITRNTAQYQGGGLCMKENSDYIGGFTMSGGIISGNTVTAATGKGGGIYYNSADYPLVVSGSAEITDNTADCGGGVYVEKGSFTVAGKVDITGNEALDGAKNNVYLIAGKTITIGTSGLDSSARIGVTPGAEIVSGSGIIAATGATSANYAAENITSDKGEPYHIVWENDTVYLYNGQPHEHPVCGDADCTDHGASVKWIGVSTLTNDMIAGNYFLTQDVELTAAWTPVNNVNLCLNGYSIFMKSSAEVIRVGENVEFTLCDCSENQTGSITHGTLSNNYKYTGRGVYVDKGTFSMYGGSITGNEYSADYRGGGVYVGLGASTFHLYGGSITENKNIKDGASHGGGVYVDYGSTFTMSGGSITGNTVTGTSGGAFGGGVCVTSSGTFIMTGGSITDNTSNASGGGVCAGGTVTITGGTISGNTAWDRGGGISVEYTATVTVSGAPTISGNKKTNGTANNVYLYKDATVTVGEAGLNSGAKIGVTTAVTPANDGYVTVAVGENGKKLTKTDLDFFTSDAGYGMQVRGGSIILAEGDVHEHAVCGKDEDHCTDGHENELWQPLTYDAATMTLYCGGEAVKSSDYRILVGETYIYYMEYQLPAGNYYLADNIALNGGTANEKTYVGGIIRTNGYDLNVNLCLNGFTLSAPNPNTPLLSAPGTQTLTLSDCKGGGKLQTAAGGYNVLQVFGDKGKGGTFTMYGGTISGARTGVYAYNYGVVNLFGGTITGNECGLEIGSNGSITVGGTVNITGNTKQNLNLYTGGKTTAIISIDSTLTQASRIGISSSLTENGTSPVQIATGATGSLDYTEIFTPDAKDQSYVVTKDEQGNLYLGLHAHSWTYQQGDTADTIRRVCPNTDGSCPNTDGGSVTVSASDVPYDRTARTATVTASENWSGDAVDGITITYKGANGTTYAESTTAPTNAGTYTASITLGGVTASAEFKITKVDPVIAWNGYPHGKSFTGSEIASPAEGDIQIHDGKRNDLDLYDEITFVWYDATTGVKLDEAPIDAGNYIIEAQFKETENTNAVSCRQELTINKAALAGTGDPFTTTINIYPAASERTYEYSLADVMTNNNIRFGGDLAVNQYGVNCYGQVKSAVVEDGKVKITMNPVSQIAPGSHAGSVNVGLSSRNYQQIPLTFDMEVVAKQTVEDLAVTMADWTYGTPQEPQYRDDHKGL